MPYMFSSASQHEARLTHRQGGQVREPTIPLAAIFNCAACITSYFPESACPHHPDAPIITHLNNKESSVTTELAAFMPSRMHAVELGSLPQLKLTWEEHFNKSVATEPSCCQQKDTSAKTTSPSTRDSVHRTADPLTG